VDRKFDLRIEDHPTPVPELRRLVRLQRAYNALNEGDGLMTVGDTEGAMRSYARAMELVPDEATNGEAPYWVGITLAASGKEEEAIPYLLRAQRRDARWAELTLRLPASKLLPSEEVARRLAERMRAGG
jgi:tetratricopeptide (TPR) repeat protein